MLVLVVSDSHGRHDNLEIAIERVKPDLVYHLGDGGGFQNLIQRMAGCPLEIVRGNCDFDATLPNDIVTELGNHKILLTHGHRYDVRFHRYGLIEAAQENGCDMVIYGHTHCPELITDEDVIIMNPGSISQPRQEGHRPSYGVIHVDDEGEITANIVYL